MKNGIKFAIAINAAIAATSGFAADKACLLEGSMKIGKQVIEIKDCMQNSGVKKEQFLQTCKGIADMGAGFGAPPKVTYLDACPAGPQGVCEGLFGQPVHSYYYKRAAKDLADTKESCVQQGGKWRNG